MRRDTKPCVCVYVPPLPAKKESRVFVAANLIDCQVHGKSRYISDVTRANLDCAFANTNKSTTRRLAIVPALVVVDHTYDSATNSTSRMPRRASAYSKYAATIRGSLENGTAVLTRRL